MPTVEVDRSAVLQTNTRAIDQSAQRLSPRGLSNPFEYRRGQTGEIRSGLGEIDRIGNRSGDHGELPRPSPLLRRSRCSPRPGPERKRSR